MNGNAGYAQEAPRVSSRWRYIEAAPGRRDAVGTMRTWRGGTIGVMLTDELLARRLTWDDARTLEGETFELVPDESNPAGVPMVVARVAVRDADPRMVQFSIVLLGPADPVYPQRTYRLRHARRGDYAFMVTPIARDAAGTSYEACFSHAA